MQVKTIELPVDQISEFCQRWKICEFSLFGSALWNDFQDSSDVDVLVAFEPEMHPTLLDLKQMQDELKSIFGRKIELVTRESIEQSENYIRRQRILNSARVVYRSGCCSSTAFTEVAKPLSPTERDESLLLDILIACHRVRRYTCGVSWEEFQKDCTLLQDATIWQLEIIGEAIKKLSPRTKELYSDIPWSCLLNVCDCLTCPDKQVDIAAIWDVIQNDIPALAQRLEPFIPAENQVCSSC